MKFLFIFVFICVSFVKSDDNSDKYWILIDSVSFLPCNGPPNQFNLTKEDVSVKDKDGNDVQFIEAPNEYYLTFNNIKVFKPLKNLAGQMGCSLSFPIFKAGSLSLDVPIQVIPQKTLLEGSQCDNESGVIYDSKDRKEYCRYCELCESATHAENKLSSNKSENKFLPKTGQSQDEGKFSKVCKQINATTYNLKRTIRLPGQQEIKDQLKQAKGSVEGPLQQKLAPGKGALVVTLQLDSYSQAPLPAKQWYSGLKNCSCCVKDDEGDSTCHQTFIEKVTGKNPSTCLKCNNQYVQVCNNGSSERVGCYVVKYNYRVTNDSKVADLFKQQLAKKKQGQPVSESVATDIKMDAAANSSQAQGQAQVNAGQSKQPQPTTIQSTPGQTKPPQSQPSGDQSPQACDQCNAPACIASLTVPNFSGYCKGAMVQPGTSGRRFCCRYCPKVCKS